MKRNPLIPFALIAALGIIVMFVFSFQGLNKSKELADAKWREASTNSIKARGYCEAKAVRVSHGDQLQGAVGPNLQKLVGNFQRMKLKKFFERKRQYACQYSSS